MEAAKLWNFDEPESLKTFYPKHAHYQNQRFLDSARRNLISRAKRRLAFYKMLEEKLGGPIEAEDIKKQLQFLLILASGHYKEVPRRLTSMLEESFNERQRLVLFRILNDVIGRLRLRGGRGVSTEDKWLC